MAILHRLRTIFREYALLRPIYEGLRDLRSALSDAIEARRLLSEVGIDDILRKLAEETLFDSDCNAAKLYDTLRRCVQLDDPDAHKSAIIEITAGVGGDEACIFAGELYRMYEKFAKSQNWIVDDLDFTPSSKSGIKSVTFKINGAGAYGKLRYESGIHRVQRFSATASTDIMHTSAAAVVVMPEIERTETIIKSSDVREDNFATGGPGGQNQNKSCNGVRLTHLPTGIVASIRENKSQIRNRERAWEVLTTRVAGFYAQQIDQKIDETRRNLRGMGSRCEKIRTYNYQQDRVTDHRIDFSVHGLDGVLNGKINPLIEKLILCDEDIQG